jgi:hypothetical protein
MSDPRTLRERFERDWLAGLRPGVEHTVTLAPVGSRAELARSLERFLLSAPVPAFDEATLAELAQSQPVREAQRAIGGHAGGWPLLLPALRRQRRLTRRCLAARLAQAIGHEQASDRVAMHLHAMESGTTDAARVTRRVLDALGALLGVSGDALERAGHARTAAGPPAPAAAAQRGFAEPPPFSEVPPGYHPVPQTAGEEWAAVDRLFLGGQP